MSVEISGKESEVEVTPVMTAGAYTTDLSIGGLLTFANVFGVKQSGILHGVVIRDKAKQSSALDLVFFNALPVQTNYADGVSPNPSGVGDFQKVQGHVNILAANYLAFSAQSEATVAGIGLPLRNVTKDDRNLYALLITRGTPTYASISDITLVLKILQD